MEPTPEELFSCGQFSAFRVPADRLKEDFWAEVARNPDESVDVWSALTEVSNAAAITGSRHRWAVWGQRDWEIALLLTPDLEGPWLDVGTALVPIEEPLLDFRVPEGWTMPLSAAEMRTLIDNVEGHGST